MKKLLKASALALAMSLVLFGCANNTKEPITAPKVDAIDTSTIKPAEAPTGTKSITKDEELKSVVTPIAKSVVEAFAKKGSPLLSDLQDLIMGTENNPSAFYTDVITPFYTDKKTVNLNLSNKTYTSKKGYGTIKINTGKVDYKLDDTNGTKVTVNGNADVNALLDIAKADSNCKVKKAAANGKAVAKDFNLVIPTEGEISASGAVAASVAASAYFDNNEYAGFVNATVSVVIPDAEKYVAKGVELQPKVNPILNAIFPPKGNPVPPTEKQLNDLAGYYDQLPMTLNVKITITDVNGGNEFEVANATKYSDLVGIYKRFGQMTTTAQ